MGLYSCLYAELFSSPTWLDGSPPVKRIAKAAGIRKYLDLDTDFVIVQFPIVVLHKRPWFHAYITTQGSVLGEHSYSVQRDNLIALINRIDTVLASPARAADLLPFTTFVHDEEKGSYDDQPGLHSEGDFETMAYARKRIKRYLKRSKGEPHNLHYRCSF